MKKTEPRTAGTLESVVRPIRIQRKRCKGYNMQAESTALNGLPAVSVCRPGLFGNPHRVGMCPMCGVEHTAAEAVAEYDEDLRFMGPIATDIIQKELRGKNLACYCPLDQPCHADILLDIANDELTLRSEAERNGGSVE